MSEDLKIDVKVDTDESAARSKLDSLKAEYEKKTINLTCVRVTIPDRLASSVMVKDFAFDYAGGFNHTLVELSDALPAAAFTKEYMD